MAQQVKVTKEEIFRLREEGKTQKEIAEHYSVSVAQVKKLYEKLGITGRPKNKAVFIIEEENNKVESSVEKEIDVNLCKKEENITQPSLTEF